MNVGSGHLKTLSITSHPLYPSEAEAGTRCDGRIFGLQALNFSRWILYNVGTLVGGEQGWTTLKKSFRWTGNELESSHGTIRYKNRENLYQLVKSSGRNKYYFCKAGRWISVDPGVMLNKPSGKYIAAFT